MDIINLKKGYDLRLNGEAEKDIAEAAYPHEAALRPCDFMGIRPLLKVSAGDRVKIGTPLFVDKSNEKICFTSPVAGTVSEIIRGERRVIEAVVVLTEGKQTQAALGLPKKNFSFFNREEIISILLSSGLFPCFIQRPFGTIANPDDIPRDIFISAFDTAPLAPDVNLILQGNEKNFQAGLDIIAKLTSGSVHLSTGPDWKNLSPALTRAKKVIHHRFSGPHPAGNVGVHIHHIAPIRHRKDIVWTLNVQSVIYIGRLFAEKRLDFTKTVAVAGSAALERKYYKTVLGASIRGFASQRYVEERVTRGAIRQITGNVLSGRCINENCYLGYYDNLITVIPEPEEYEILGWLMPGINKLSRSRTFYSTIFRPRALFNESAAMHGGRRAFIATGIYEEVLPMDILPVFLIKSILAEDIEEMEGLGIYEVIEEDLALCEYIDPSKNEFQNILRQGLEYIQKEG